MNTKKINRLVISLVVFLFFLTFPVSLLAQSSGSTSGPKIIIKITSTLDYDESSRELTIPVSLENKTTQYFDNLYYGIEIYLGDKLREEGYLFADTKYSGGGIFPIPDEFKALAPGEKTEFNFTYKHEPGIQSGNYFFKVDVSDQVGTVYGLDYSREPVAMEGENSSLGFFQCYFRIDENTFSPGVGSLASANVSPEVIMVVGQDEAVVAKIEQGNYYIASEVYLREITGELVRAQQKRKAEVTEDEPTVLNLDEENQVSLGLVIKDKLQAGLPGNSYRVKTVLLDEKDKEVSIPCYSRWVVEGPAARINEIITSQNSYKKGEAYDLQVKVNGPPDDSEMEASLKLILYDQKNRKIDEIIKENLQLGPKALLVDFSDKVFDQATAIGRLEFVLADQSGNQLDEASFSYKSEEGAAGSRWQNSKLNWLLLVSSLVALGIILVLIFKARSKKNDY